MKVQICLDISKNVDKNIASRFGDTQNFEIHRQYQHEKAAHLGISWVGDGQSRVASIEFGLGKTCKSSSVSCKIQSR